MSIKDLPEMNDISDGDQFTIIDHMVYRNGKQIPFIPHEKRSGRTTIDPKFFIYHYTAGRYGIDSTVNFMKNADTKADVHLVLDASGRLVQMAPLNEKCWHAGKSAYDGYNGLNSWSNGIEVINPGPLDIIGRGIYKTWYGVVYYNPTVAVGGGESVRNQYPNAIAHPGIVEMSHQIHTSDPKKGWIPYTPEQVNVMTNLSQAIVRNYGSKLLGHDEITDRKRDPGPLSQIEMMRDIIAGRDDVDDEDTVVEHVEEVVRFYVPENGASDSGVNKTKGFLENLFRFFNR